MLTWVRELEKEQDMKRALRIEVRNEDKRLISSYKEQIAALQLENAELKQRA